MATYSFPSLEVHQTRLREPTEWETALAGAIEAAFGAGHHALPALVAALNASRSRPREGGLWTEASLAATLKDLGA
jgi:hypothetical protein